MILTPLNSTHVYNTNAFDHFFFLMEALVDAIRLNDEGSYTQLLDDLEDPQNLLDLSITRLALDYEKSPFPPIYLETFLHLAQSRNLLTPEILLDPCSLTQHPEITERLLSFAEPNHPELLSNALYLSLGFPEIGRQLLHFDNEHAASIVKDVINMIGCDRISSDKLCLLLDLVEKEQIPLMMESIHFYAFTPEMLNIFSAFANRNNIQLETISPSKMNQDCIICLENLPGPHANVNNAALPLILHQDKETKWYHRICEGCAFSLGRQPLEKRRCPFPGCNKLLTLYEIGMDERVKTIFLQTHRAESSLFQGWLL